MLLIILKILLIVLIFALCYFYFRRRQTFEIQKIPNVVIYFVTANSAWMTAACTLMYSGVIIGSFFPALKVDTISPVIYLPQSIIALSYGVVWLYEYLRIKRNLSILIIALLHLGIAAVNTVIFWFINSQQKFQFNLSPQNNAIIENIFIIIWFLLFFSFVLWHLWAPFRMNWRKWLSNKDYNVFYETFNVFFFMAFPFSHYILIVLYTGFNQAHYLNLFILAISLFIMFSIFDTVVWLTTSIMPKTDFFRSFKNIFFMVFPTQSVICVLLIILNILKII